MFHSWAKNDSRSEFVLGLPQGRREGSNQGEEARCHPWSEKYPPPGRRKTTGLQNRQHKRSAIGPGNCGGSLGQFCPRPVSVAALGSLSPLRGDDEIAFVKADREGEKTTKIPLSNYARP